MSKLLTRRNAARLGAVGLAVASAGTLAATAAGASTTHGTVTATTRIIQRYDGGGAGNWAVDSFTRKLTLTYLGKSGDPAHPYAYTAYLADDGGFTDLPGQLTPNQGGRYAGTVLKPVQVAGSMTGYAQWNVFDASTKAVRGLVPTSLRGLTLNANSAYATSTWPELAFQSGTTFAGVNLGSWDWGYHVPALTVTSVRIVHGHKVTVRRVLRAQNWDDGSYSGAGQLRGDGQITGRN